MAARGCKRQGWKEFGKEIQEGGGAEGLVGRKAGRHIGAWRQVIHVGEPREVVLGAGAGLSKKAVQGGCDTGSNQLWVVSHQPACRQCLAGWLAQPSPLPFLDGRGRRHAGCGWAGSVRRWAWWQLSRSARWRCMLGPSGKSSQRRSSPAGGGQNGGEGSGKSEVGPAWQTLQHSGEHPDCTPVQGTP